MLILSKRPVAKNITNMDLDIEGKDGKLGWSKSYSETDGGVGSYASINFEDRDWTKKVEDKLEKKKGSKNTLKPKCLLTNRDLSYSVTGHILPCCWVNTAWEDKQLKNLFKDKLHIDNNKSIEEILNKDEWKDFMKLLENSPDKDIPPVCKRYCSVDLERNVENERKLYANNLL